MASLSSTITLIAIIYASLTNALPSPLRLGSNTTMTVPASASVIWYQAAEQATNTTCGEMVSKGTIQVNQCYTLYTAGVGIQQHENSSCVFKVWDGVSDCSGNGTWTATAIPKGVAMTCVTSDVLDGGDFQHKSGVYTCA